MEKTMFQLVLIFFCWSSSIKGDDSSVIENRFDVESLNKLVSERNPHFAETFNDKEVLTKKWILSMAKKDGVEGDLAKYDGDWIIESPQKHAIVGDHGLLFKQRAKHRAISALLKKEYHFNDRPFILQYEVLFQDGQECGGGYIKLISGNRNNINLKNFRDKTPYTIMFGPDKCGSTSKIHFIFRHKNPLNGSFEEKHCKPPSTRIDEVFTDSKPHLFSLILQPDNSYKILLDHKVINEGTLLTDFTPPVNPPSEVDDPNDTKPADWDDREKIPDPDATKPDDWDEDAPHTISDPSATKPDNWLDDEPLYVRDPSAEKPHDWDVEMDGAWEAPLVPNPACEDAAGCGEWTPPKINNPAYKGKWSPPLIQNPDYKGKWSPRKIPNADFFEDKHPFKMEKIGAVGFELWSMSSNILFDNILLTDDEEFAKKWVELTYDVKMQKIEQSAESLVGQIINFTNQYPWLWALYTIGLLIMLTLLVYCFCWRSKDSYQHKKTDEPQDNVEHSTAEVDEDVNDDGNNDSNTNDDDTKPHSAPSHHSVASDHSVDSSGSLPFQHSLSSHHSSTSHRNPATHHSIHSSHHSHDDDDDDDIDNDQNIQSNDSDIEPIEE